MALETHPAFNGESKTPHAGGGFESSKETKRRRRRERRPERVRSHERAQHAPLEPLTIWVRSDPNRLQHPDEDRKEKQEKQKDQVHETRSQKQEADKEAKKQPSKSVKVASVVDGPVKEQEPRKESQANNLATDPRAEVVIPTPEAPKKPKTEYSQQPVEDTQAFQELPRLDIRPRHFYTEPEVRQPDTTETTHDMLPAAKPEVSKEASTKQPTQEQQQTSQTAPTSEALPQTGAQLQELAERNAKRAAELFEKNQESPELPAPHKESQTSELNEHVRAITGGNYEADIMMGRNELLEVGESIRVEGVSVTEMYRAERIDEEGLKRIIVEFLRGERIEKIISEEVLRQQMRFERDPQLRQIPVNALQNTSTRSQTPTNGRQRKAFNAQNMRRQADRIADRLAGGIDRAVETAENNPNAFKTVGGILAVIIYFVILILIIRS